MEVTACSYTYKARSFYLIYRCGHSGGYSLLKLKSPSRLARETFLIALGIAKYEGNILNLDKSSVLFPDFETFSTCSKKVPTFHLNNDEKEGNEKELTSVSAQSPPTSKRFQHDFDKGTPVNSKMLAIETELENDMVQLRDKLEAKNEVVSELHDELTHLHDAYNCTKTEYTQCKKKLRLSERRIE